MPTNLPLGYRPNIIYLKLDDFRIPEGFDAQCMPYFASIKANWLWFKNGVCAASVCAPNRAVSYTGQHGIINGCTTNRNAQNVDWSSTWMHALRANGYAVLGHGKHINDWMENSGWGSDTDLPFGFSYFSMTSGGPNYFNHKINRNGIVTTYGDSGANGGSDANYVTDVEGADIVAEIAAVKLPFALYFGAKPSHSDGDLAVPAPRHATEPIVITHPASFNPPNNGLQPAWYYQQYPRNFTSAEVTTLEASMTAGLRSATAFDEALHAIIDALTARGILETTIICLDTDNGFADGKHLNDQKGTLFEECINSSLFVRMPGGSIGSKTRLQRVSAVDMAETFCHLTGSRMPQMGNGMSLYHCLTDATEPLRKESMVFAAVDPDAHQNPSCEGIRGLDYTSARGRPSGIAIGQKWKWPDVDQQLVSVGLPDADDTAISKLMDMLGEHYPGQ